MCDVNLESNFLQNIFPLTSQYAAISLVYLRVIAQVF